MDVQDSTKMQMIEQITDFIENVIPEIVRRFSLGEEYVKKYYHEYFTDDATQVQNFADGSPAYDVITIAKNNCKNLLSSGKSTTRYKEYTLRINPEKPIELKTAIAPIMAIAHAFLKINGIDHGQVIYELRYEEETKRWRIEKTRELCVTPDHLAMEGVMKERVFKVEPTSLNILQRLIRFKYKFDSNDWGKKFWLNKNTLRSNIEDVAESLIFPYLNECAHWDQVIEKPKIGKGIPDLLLIYKSIRFGIEIKTDNFSQLITKLKHGELDKGTKNQLQRFCIGNSIDELYLVLFHNHSGDIKSNYKLPIDEKNHVYIFTIDYGR